MGFPSLDETFHDIVRNRDEENCNDAGCQHAAEDSEAEENSSMGASSRSEHEGYNTEYECEGRHQNRPESHLGRRKGCLRDGFPSLKLDLRKFHNKDCILG